MTTCTANNPRIVQRGSIEYVDVEVTADVALGTQAVAISFEPYPYSWVTAAWEGAAGTTRTASVLADDASFPEDEEEVEVFVKVTDSPEVPIRSAGPLYRP